MFVLQENFFIYGLLLFAYLSGSVPWGVVLTRISSAADPRRHGSGNVGATNVARVAGAGLGLATLAADILKGWLPVCLLSAALPAAAGGDHGQAWTTAAALLAFSGHLFPVYTRFRGGGKGVATAAGGFAGIAPAAVLVAAGVFLFVFCLSRRVSASSLVAAAVLPFAVYAITLSAAAGFGALLAASMIFLRHRDNLRRLLAGTEPEFRFKQDLK
jgi:glycerol-3-phosphate acyltransferase PlsY